MSVFSDPMIDPAAHERIEAELDAIEREHDVRILLAVESGSRAWRFPSRDSDHDVRFLYVRPVRAYLSVIPGRDVIERPIDATLDVNGWDLHKAFRLLARSNAVLLEWLTSPVRYRADEDAVARVLALARSAADLTAIAYHYDRLARRAFDTITASGEEPRLKTYCYALRAAMALSWIRRFHAPPPMDLPSLMAGLEPARGISDAILRLLARKADADESGTTPRDPVLDRFLEDVLGERIARIARMEQVDRAAGINALFASIVLENGQSALAGC